ncbi:MAG: amidohydrolase family protein [Clostridiales bacterium]|jgi:predicted amidohydrolase YtcJ|nr:amidohydrolase family protein [Clostridiales bacterium]
MSSKFVIKNAKIFDRGSMVVVSRDIVVDDNTVAAVTPSETDSGLDAIDLGGKILLRSFCDNHLHVPGTKLYDMYGINLAACVSMEEYAAQIRAKVSSLRGVIKGFGWSPDIVVPYFKNDDRRSPLEFLDAVWSDTAMILFSNDFHSCWCNGKAVKLLGDYGIKYTASEGVGGGCIFHGLVAKEIFGIKELSFDKREIRRAVLAYQKQLIGYGITEAFTFMFIGASRLTVLGVLRELEREQKLDVTFHCCYDIYPDDTTETILSGIRASGEFKSRHVDFVFAKIYVDGVIDNYSAWLKAPYADKDACGACLWRQETLQRTVDFLQARNIPVHAHAVGDLAVRTIVDCILRAGHKSALRNVIAHVQLCDRGTVKDMADNKIIACMQPFWFFDSEERLEEMRLGDRARLEYPINDIVAQKCGVLFSSDSPVTIDFSPLSGIKTACRKINGNAEEAFMTSLDAFTVNAYFGGNSQISNGVPADFVCTSAKNLDDVLDGDAVVEWTMKDGRRLEAEL